MPPPLISIVRARELVHEHVEPLDHEQVEVGDALDRVLAEDVRAAGDVPPFACSAMDGYAIKAGPGRPDADRDRRVAGRHPARRSRSATARRSGSRPAPPCRPAPTAVIRQEDDRGTATGR